MSLREKISSGSSGLALPRIARRKLAQRAARTGLRSTESLGAFIPRITPIYATPTHLAPLTQELERAEGGRVRLCFSVPPRHGKSETLLHYLAWLLHRNPRLQLLYVTHTQTFAARQSKSVKRLAREAGVELLDGSNRADEWDTTSGGGLVARGVDGEITGRGFDVIVVDDPIKSTSVAESALQRDGMADWFTRDCFSRLTPTGSIIVVHTRWHVDDLSGRLTSQLGFTHLNLPAIDDDGNALWPDGGWTVDVLDERRHTVGEYGWASLYQGAPRPKGGTVFQPASFYRADQLPAKGYRVAHGIDLAYSSRTHADYSVCWTMLVEGGTYYVVDVKRQQVQAPEFAATLRTQQGRWPARMRWYGSTTEVGAGQLLEKLGGLSINAMLAKADKFTRAQPLAAAWNDGRILLPAGDDDSQPEWVQAVVSEFADFTGVHDKHDDIVDAAAACFDELAISGPLVPRQDHGPALSRWDGFESSRGF